ncbi:MAG: hypothetical protein HQ523_10370 [Lentisphaerae bacterium]|nr:hypothetical protein [Lentisphaerota bacterium]
MDADTLPEKRKRAAQLLRDVLAGDLTPEEARATWPDANGDASLDSAFHALFHFEDDADVRGRDKKYADWQTSDLKQMADALSLGVSLV